MNITKRLLYICAVHALVMTAVILGGVVTPLAHEGHHGDDHDHESNLHFSHPINAESPTPDTKVRIDHFYRRIENEEDTANEHTARLEMEYAFDKAFSIEIDAPFTIRTPDGAATLTHTDMLSVALKFANFAFAEHNLLLGYGIEFGLPTGSENKGIASDHLVELAPFLNIGYQAGQWEFVSFAVFGIPINQDSTDEVETEMEFNGSALYHASERVAFLAEYDGSTVTSGPESGRTVLNIGPGIKFRPLSNPHLKVGIGTSFPVSTADEFDFQTALSVFYHF